VVRDGRGRLDGMGRYLVALGLVEVATSLETYFLDQYFFWRWLENVPFHWE